VTAARGKNGQEGKPQNFLAFGVSLASVAKPTAATSRHPNTMVTTPDAQRSKAPTRDRVQLRPTPSVAINSANSSMTTTSQHKNSIFAHDLTPRPRWPMNLHTSYAPDEGGTRDFAISTPHFSRGRRVQEIHKMQNSGAPPFEPIPGAEQATSPSLPTPAPPKASSPPPPADEAGQSLIVWAINEGRDCARRVKCWLNDSAECR